MNRLKSLKRFEAVQKRMVTLASMRLTAADKLCRDIAHDKEVLSDFIGQHEAIGPILSRSALRTGKVLDDRLIRAKELLERQKLQLDSLKRREHVANSLVAAEQVVARRLEEDRDLRETIEAWQAQHRASLR